MSRDDFSPRVKHDLARRVAYRCSHAGCPQVTVGPSKSAEGTLSVGVAAHITAAAPGGPRFDPSLTPAQRRSASNGIWMCQTHARLVDVDHSITVAQLCDWKRAAEQRAAEALKLAGADALLLSETLSTLLPGAALNESVGVLLERCGVLRAWGRSEHGCVQDLLIELARNAFDHGAASDVTLSVTTHKITLSDNGVAFDPLRSIGVTPPPTMSGGRLALSRIARLHDGDLLTTYRRNGEANEFSIVRVEGASLSSTMPCVLHFGIDDVRRSWKTTVDVSSVAGCSTVIISAPDYMALSDVMILCELLARAFPPSSEVRLLLVLPRATGGAEEIVAQMLPDAKVLRTDRARSLPR